MISSVTSLCHMITDSLCKSDLRKICLEKRRQGSIVYSKRLDYPFYKGTCWHSDDPLQCCHNGHHGVSNQQHDNCLLNRLFRRRPTRTSKLRITGLCAGNSPVTGEFPAQGANNAENVSIWWRHHALRSTVYARDRHITHWSQSKIAIIFTDGIFNLLLKETYCKFIQISNMSLWAKWQRVCIGSTNSLMPSRRKTLYKSMRRHSAPMSSMA